MGSPRVAGSTSRSSSGARPGSTSAAARRPSPARRTLSLASGSASGSSSPRLTVERVGPRAEIRNSGKRRLPELAWKSGVSRARQVAGEGIAGIASPVDFPARKRGKHGAALAVARRRAGRKSNATKKDNSAAVLLRSRHGPATIRTGEECDEMATPLLHVNGFLLSLTITKPPPDKESGNEGF